MSDETPTEDRLAALDARARGAVDQLDRALSGHDVPRFEPAGSRRGVAPWLVVAAAAVAVLAVVGAALGFLDDGDEQSTVAGEPTPSDEFVRLALPEPNATGHRVVAAYDDVDDGAAATSPATGHQIHGPADAEDPWSAAVVSADTVDTPHHLYGQLIDLEGAPAVVVTDDERASVTWPDGSLMSTAVGPEALAELAAEAVRSGWDHGQPLRGHRILQQHAAYVDPAFVYGDQRAQASTIAYTHADGPSFVVATMPGGEAEWRGRAFWAERVERTTVRGEEATVLSWRGSLPGGVEVTWRENDATVVVVRTWDDVASVLPLIERLGQVDAATVADLERTHPADDGGPLIEVPSDTFDRGDPFTEAPDEVLARLSVQVGTSTADAVLYRDAGEPTSAAAMVSSTDGGSGQGMVVPATGFASATSGSDSERDFVFAIVPGPPASVAFRSSHGSDAVPLAGFESTPVAGTSHHLVVGWTAGPPAPYDDDESDPWNHLVEVTLADGEVVQIAV